MIGKVTAPLPPQEKKAVTLWIFMPAYCAKMAKNWRSRGERCSTVTFSDPLPGWKPNRINCFAIEWW